MALTDTFIKQVKSSGKPAGDKYADGGGMYLLVKPTGKYWRMDYRFADKRKTLALGVYPAVSAVTRQKTGSCSGHSPVPLIRSVSSPLDSAGVV